MTMIEGVILEKTRENQSIGLQCKYDKNIGIKWIEVLNLLVSGVH